MTVRARALALVLAAAFLASGARAEPVLMPQPRAMTTAPGVLPLPAPFVAKAEGCPQPLIDRALARFRADVTRQRGLADVRGDGPALAVRCLSRDAAYLSDDAQEAYRLDIDARGVRIEADGPAGALHGLATLRQLTGVGTAPAALHFVHIDDAPRFAWRGMMIDTARHFMSLAALKRQVDAMERVKLDVLHLHLSDNEGFRVESRLYPSLQATQHGEFYTQAEIREFVAYAADRGVRIVPEFDVPAHTGAIAAAYPRIAAAGDPASAFGAFDRALNPASPETYRFLDGLLGEMAGLFPDRDFHVGGDEVSDAAWSHEPAVATFMAAHGLTSRAQMEAYFHTQVREMLRRRGKTTIGWEEIATTPIPRDVIVQAWRNSNATGLSVTAGHRTIVSAGYYLDQLMPAASHYAVDPLDLQADGLSSETVAELAKASPLAGGAAKPLELKAMPPLTAPQQKLILGGEMALWSELVSDEMLDARLGLAPPRWPNASGRRARSAIRKASPVACRSSRTHSNSSASRPTRVARRWPRAWRPRRRRRCPPFWRRWRRSATPATIRVCRRCCGASATRRRSASPPWPTPHRSMAPPSGPSNTPRAAWPLVTARPSRRCARSFASGRRTRRASLRSPLASQTWKPPCPSPPMSPRPRTSVWPASTRSRRAIRSTPGSRRAPLP